MGVLQAEIHEQEIEKIIGNNVLHFNVYEALISIFSSDVQLYELIIPEKIVISFVAGIACNENNRYV